MGPFVSYKEEGIVNIALQCNNDQYLEERQWNENNTLSNCNICSVCSEQVIPFHSLLI
jgi:hypothetical protein